MSDLINHHVLIALPAEAELHGTVAIFAHPGHGHRAVYANIQGMPVLNLPGVANLLRDLATVMDLDYSATLPPAADR